MDEPTAVVEDIGRHSLMELFDELSFSEKWHRVSEGLKMPKDTGEYKWAKLQMIRLSAPASAVVVPVILLLLVGILAAIKPPPKPPAPVQIMEPEQVDKLEDIKEEIIEPPEPPEPVEVEPTDIISDSPYVGAEENATPGPKEDFSPVPSDIDAVAIVKSPIIFKGIYGSRSPGARGKALAGGGGGSWTEAAVLRALRWLKKNQSEDGSWPATKPAMTSLAILTYLAHGETPSSEEFGYTVEKALRWLLENFQEAGAKFNGSDGHEYSLPIAAYALSEAYGLTQISDIKYVAEKAINRIIAGQHANGGWNYNCNADARDDTSYMGWCAQALKAAKMAQLDCPGLDEAMKKAIKGFKINYAGNYDDGGFGYTGPAKHGLTPVGTLCMQLMGASKADEVMGSLNNLNGASWMQYDLDNPGPGKTALYYWYYATQAKFHAGGATWNAWNKVFSPELVKKQHVTKKEASGYVDHKGVPRDIGFWDQYGGHGANENPVFSTCLATLQLEVYYRYLPTFKAPADVDLAAEPAKRQAGKEEKKDDLKIDLGGL